jgi:hypothetical protein
MVFPVIFPVNREFAPGDGFAADYKHHQTVLFARCVLAPAGKLPSFGPIGSYFGVDLGGEQGHKAENSSSFWNVLS